MRIKLVHSYRWGNTFTGADYSVGIITLALLGLIVYVLWDRKTYRAHCIAMGKMGFNPMLFPCEDTIVGKEEARHDT